MNFQNYYRQNHKSEELPLGLSVSLAENAEALAYFARLTSAKRQEIAERSRDITTQQEMRQYVSSLREWERL